MRAILQVVYGENCAILGAVLFDWQQTFAWVIRKTGTLLSFILGESKWKCFQVGYPVDTPTDLADVVCFEVQCFKNPSNVVFTHISNVDESIYVVYFQQKNTFSQNKK